MTAAHQISLAATRPPAPLAPLAPRLRHDPQVRPGRLPALGVNPLRLDLVEVAARRHRIDQDELDLLIWTDDEDVADGLLSAGVRPSEVPLTLAGNMPYSFETLRSGSPIIGKLGAKS